MGKMGSYPTLRSKLKKDINRLISPALETLNRLRDIDTDIARQGRLVGEFGESDV